MASRRVCGPARQVERLCLRSKLSVLPTCGLFCFLRKGNEQSKNKKKKLIMRQGQPSERRSARLAEKQREKEKEKEKDDEISEAVKALDRKSEEKVGRTGKQEKSEKPTKNEEEEKKMKKKARKSTNTEEGVTSSSSSSSEDEPKKGVDDPALVGLWSYPATKEWHPKELPTPFRMTTPKVLKAPRLWPLLWDSMAVTESDFVTTRNLDGEVTKAFAELITQFYEMPGGVNYADPLMVSRLKNKWRILSGLYFAADEPDGLFRGAGDGLMKEAEALLVSMDASLLSRVHGPRAATHFRESLKLSLSLFAGESAAAARQAIRKRARDGPGGYWRQNDEDQEKDIYARCRYCREMVVRGTFDAHNQVCPKRKGKRG